MSVENHAIERLIAPVIEDLGFELVRVNVGKISGRGAPAVQVMAERPDGSMSIDDCAKLSRALSAVLEEADPITGAYTLEVSSPGIDRPLVRLADFERFMGEVARLQVGSPIDGQRRFTGRIARVGGREVELDLDGETVRIAYDDIVKAKLAMTDDLVKGGKGRP